MTNDALSGLDDLSGLNSESELPHLSDVIDYDTDIAPYQFIKINAGVGSGKNVFVDNLVKGNVFRHSDGTPVGRKYILLLTSRRAKANEQLNMEGLKYDGTIGAFDQIDYYFDDDACCEYENSESRMLPDLGGLCGREIKLRSCSCTNAQAEIACEEFLPLEPYTHPWERFDFIVIDEVHSLLSDANYQSAPFFVQRLVEETRTRSSKCKVIVMTGSPAILENYPLLHDFHLIDKMDVCENLTPKKIIFVSQRQASELLQRCFAENEKAVCFFNRIDEITKTAGKFSPQQQQRIAVSFTNPEKRRNLKKGNSVLYENMKNAERSLAEHRKLPEDTVLFLTNAKNKEGINIKNTDIRTMFVEAHSEVDIKQMVGRVRNGIENLYVVVDSQSFDDPDLPGELSFTVNSDLLAAVNRHLDVLAEGVSSESKEREGFTHSKAVKEYVEFIHAKFPYIRFDYFLGKFSFYSQRKLSKDYYDRQNELFASSRTSAGLAELAHSWFPDAVCDVQICIIDDMKRSVDEYITRHRLMEKRLPKSAAKEVLGELKSITHSSYTRLGDLLRLYGYKKVDLGKTATGDWTVRRL